MLTTVPLTIHAVVAVTQITAIGTNLGLANLLWAMLRGAFLTSRGGIFPALYACGLEAAAMRRSWAALRYGAWTINELLRAWQRYVSSQAQWQARRYEGQRVVSLDMTSIQRPRLVGWLDKQFCSKVGRAVPAVGLGLRVIVGQVAGQRLPLLSAIVRCDPAQRPTAQRISLLAEAARRDEPQDVKVLDAGFSLREIEAAGLCGYVLRLALNCTARHNQLPPYQGRGPYPKYGPLVRPLARSHTGQQIAASTPERELSFEEAGHTIRVKAWYRLVTSDKTVNQDQATFNLYVFDDSRYARPLILASDLDLRPRSLFLIYRDRWAVEQVPLAAKQLLGLQRQFVFAHESCFRLPELACLAGNILSYVAAVAPPLASGFWDRTPHATPGRLRRQLSRAELPDFGHFDPRLREKRSVSEHLPTGVAGHRRQKRAA